MRILLIGPARACLEWRELHKFKADIWVVDLFTENQVMGLHPLEGDEFIFLPGLDKGIIRELANRGWKFPLGMFV